MGAVIFTRKVIISIIEKRAATRYKNMETKKQALADISKEIPFKVPENYFLQLNESIMANLPEKEAPMIRKVTMWEKTKPWVYLAAMFLGLFFTIKVLTTSTQTNSSEKNTASTSISQQDYWSDVKISEEEFFNYIEAQFVDENYYDLVNSQDNSNSL